MKPAMRQRSLSLWSLRISSSFWLQLILSTYPKPQNDCELLRHKKKASWKSDFSFLNFLNLHQERISQKPNLELLHFVYLVIIAFDEVCVENISHIHQFPRSFQYIVRPKSVRKLIFWNAGVWSVLIVVHFWKIYAQYVIYNLLVVVSCRKYAVNLDVISIRDTNTERCTSMTTFYEN